MYSETYGRYTQRDGDSWIENSGPSTSSTATNTVTRRPGFMQRTIFGFVQRTFGNFAPRTVGGFAPRTPAHVSISPGFGSTTPDHLPRTPGHVFRTPGHVPRMPGGFAPRMPGGFAPRTLGQVPISPGFGSRTPGHVPRTPGNVPRTISHVPRTPGHVPRMPGGFTPRTPGGFATRTPGGFVPRMPGGFTPRTPGQVPTSPSFGLRMPGHVSRTLGHVPRTLSHVPRTPGFMPRMPSYVPRTPEQAPSGQAAVHDVLPPALTSFGRRVIRGRRRLRDDMSGDSPSTATRPAIVSGDAATGQNVSGEPAHISVTPDSPSSKTTSAVSCVVACQNAGETAAPDDDAPAPVVSTYVLPFDQENWKDNDDPSSRAVYEMAYGHLVLVERGYKYANMHPFFTDENEEVTFYWKCTVPNCGVIFKTIESKNKHSRGFNTFRLRHNHS